MDATRRPDRIFLIGLSGSGKSTVATIVAQRLGWDVADSDDIIEHAAGRTIPELFADEGEPSFRERERHALELVAGLDHVIVATGGGAILTPLSRRAIASGFVVWLSVSPRAAAERLEATPGSHGRPLLEGGIESRLTGLLEDRTRYYSLADAVVDVEGRTPAQVAAEVVRRWQEAAHRLASYDLDRLDPALVSETAAPTPEPAPAELEPPPVLIEPGRTFPPVILSAPEPSFTLPPNGLAATVRTQTRSYDITVAEGVADRLGAICREAGLTGRAFLVTDSAVGPRFAESVSSALSNAGYITSTITIPSGEAYKTLATVQLVFDRLLDARAERTDFLVCLGGGVVTDLAGFAASTYLRGIDFVHVPTTLLGMVDASIGGKTGVDHARGKNLIGAFAQPRAVVIDPAFLQTLPPRELRAGWAEVIKHGLILDPDLVSALEAGASDPRAMMSPHLIGWSTAIKAAVVSEDEREADRRMLLNYGHTVGHALEAVTGYSAWLHGEAVAIGMRAAGFISRELGLLTPADFDRQQSLIRAYGLPESAPGVPVDQVIEATALDKKVRSGAIRWVILDGIGNATTRNDIPESLVRTAVETVLQ
ncbi:MAG: 3-dehydroquinate synthase [Tepidiformaceae bacterium]